MENGGQVGACGTLKISNPLPHFFFFFFCDWDITDGFTASLSPQASEVEDDDNGSSDDDVDDDDKDEDASSSGDEEMTTSP